MCFPIPVTPSSSYVPLIDLDSSSPSSIPPKTHEALEVTHVPSIVHVLDWKTLEYVGSEVGNPSNTHQTRSNFSLMTNVLGTDDPGTYAQAKGNPHWEQDMSAKYESLLRSNIWSLVPLPLGNNIVRCKWVYKTKFTAEGQIEKYKARLVAKGFNPLEGIDYNQTFSLFAKMNTLRTIVSLATSFKWEIHKKDVKSAFLNGDLTKEIYIQQPLGFISTESSSLVWKLHKSLYGLKQASRAWYDKIDAYLFNNGFKHCISDPNLYVKSFGDNVLIIVLYVDDLIITRRQPVLIQDMKISLQKQ